MQIGSYHSSSVFHSICISACLPGKYGINCSEECPMGRYGLLCVEFCQCSMAECDKALECLNIGKYIDHRNLKVQSLLPG